MQHMFIPGRCCVQENTKIINTFILIALHTQMHIMSERVLFYYESISASTLKTKNN